MTSTQSQRIQAGYEPIDGYILEKRLGRGGYGEVWLAEAPGGLKKAVKFVFGQHDERRATQEFKSLERIKRVNHPFILTLERFELVQDRLVIVTELADGSLDDVFRRYRESGSCGIPREELLGYLRDAADALDYLHQLYKLQHLDIKPANLLIVGRHVKVADFGLLKDLGEVESSLINGLTPIYAPPEVFDGRPSLHSDQYSLAVMFQELLTGSRPFSGRSLAQLATQHVHNAPNLNPLPPSDRPCVARALEKSPDRRFHSCTEFVEKLFNPHRADRERDRANANRPPEPVFYPVENLPDLAAGAPSKSSVDQTHALVIGLGGTGSDCLHRLRSRVEELGADSPLVLHSVLIDTDRLSIQSAEMIEATPQAPRSHVLHTALRQPSEYRDSGTSRLKTISRRWIYNVPRNHATGGMRPLGRLAAVDHGPQLLQLLSDAISELGQSPSPRKVYVVGSLSGGSGSGMYVDVVHLLRHLLDESRMEDQCVLSLLTTNRFQGDPARPLALHTTKSGLMEINHFLAPGNGYPGDAGAGWPAVPAARTPLGDAYLITPSDQPGATNVIESAVNYVWADATLCGDWLQQTRESDPRESQGPPCIRSLGIVPIGDSDDSEIEQLASVASESVLIGWIGDNTNIDDAVRAFVHHVEERCQNAADATVESIEASLGSGRDQQRGRLRNGLKSLDSDQLADADAICRHLAAVLDANAVSRDANDPTSTFRQRIKHEVTLWLHNGRLDLASARRAVELLREELRHIAEELLLSSETAILQVKKIWCQRRSEGGPRYALLGRRRARSVHNLLRDACDLGEQLLSPVAYQVAAARMKFLAQQLRRLENEIAAGSAILEQALKWQQQGARWTTARWGSMDQAKRQCLAAAIKRLHSDHALTLLAASLEDGTPQACEEQSRRVLDVLTESSIGVAGELLQPTAETAPSESTASPEDTTSLNHRSTEHRSGSDADADSPHSDARTTDSTSVSSTRSWSSSVTIITSLEAALAAARPSLLDCGGKQRRLLVCRSEAEKQRLMSQLDEPTRAGITCIVATTSLPLLIHEAQRIEVSRLISWLDSITGDDGSISGRLISRCDLDLSPP
ncbi:protein kinase [Roseiconus nitratireducens]|uniref:Protein kinase n=1 Tax=Roseiconus nitratireducens TaxID=2605748 RepID=A0A5M6DLP8_9BACT|nr:tubulin-like doman-containing protein [Roseiconus nitratireducens]KAA5547182.1 protein kinase [Roseiconus nitratireducens]